MARLNETVPALVTITGQSAVSTPYAIQSEPAATSRANIRKERSATCLVRQTRTTWGRKETTVRKPAAYPRYCIAGHSEWVAVGPPPGQAARPLPHGRPRRHSCGGTATPGPNDRGAARPPSGHGAPDERRRPQP